MFELLVALKWPLIVVQGLTSLLLIIFILLQAGKGDDMASALSGQMGGGVQGSGGASKVLVRATVICAVIFMINSIVLAKVFKEISSSSVAATVAEPLAPASANDTTAASPAPATPVPAPLKKAK